MKFETPTIVLDIPSRGRFTTTIGGYQEAERLPLSELEQQVFEIYEGYPGAITLDEARQMDLTVLRMIWAGTYRAAS